MTQVNRTFRYIKDRLAAKLAVTLLAMLTPVLSYGQAAPSGTDSLNTPELLLYLAMSLVAIVALLVLAVAVYTLTIIKLIIKKENQVPEEAEATEEISFWANLDRKVLTAAVPLEKEETILLDHNYDGIKELDNHLPPWWKYMFYLTIVFAVVYLLAYHVFDTLPLQEQEYQSELAEAKAQAESRKLVSADAIDETNVEATTNEQELANGKVIYDRNCAVCHANDGGGGVGPNLTDVYWLHGGSVNDLFKTIKYGVPQKGMIAWQATLKPADIRDVSSYILTMQGTTPAKPKEPQGELYQPAPEAAGN